MDIRGCPDDVLVLKFRHTQDIYKPVELDRHQFDWAIL